MKFLNPWIDPRITLVRPEAAQAYLLRRGWKLVGPALNSAFLQFEAPGDGEDRPTVLLPTRMNEGALLQRMIELVADLSRWEDRWAVEVLQDILQQPAGGLPTDSPGVPAPAEPAPK